MATATRRTGRTAKARASTRRRPIAAAATRRRTTAPVLHMPSALVAAKSDPDVVEIPERTVVCIDGSGGPDGESFGRSIQALYGVAYGLKFARKPAGRDFKIGPLEGRWWAEGAPSRSRAGVPPRETWRWRLRLAVPDDVSDAEIAAVARAATTRKGGKLEGSPEPARVARERVRAQVMGRVLHRGPYADEPASFERIRAALSAAGRTGGNAHLEVYLSDPRRTRPEKLKTVLLLELAR